MWKKERESIGPKEDRWLLESCQRQKEKEKKKHRACQQWGFIMDWVMSKRSYSKNQKDVFLLPRREKNRYKYCMWISQIKIFSITLKAWQVCLLKKIDPWKSTLIQQFSQPFPVGHTSVLEGKRPKFQLLICHWTAVHLLVFLCLDLQDCLPSRRSTIRINKLMYMKILCKISITYRICWSKINFRLIFIHGTRTCMARQKASQHSFSKCFNRP